MVGRIFSNSTVWRKSECFAALWVSEKYERRKKRKSTILERNNSLEFFLKN